MKSPLSAFRSSLVFRVTGTIVGISIVLVWFLGTVLNNQISSGIFDDKLKLSISDAQSTARNAQIQLTFSQYQDKAALKLIFGEILSVPPQTFDSSAREIAVFSDEKTKARYKFNGTSNLLNSSSVPDSFREQTRNSKGTECDRVEMRYFD